NGVVSGDQAFRLYDTFGFPLELTREMAAERNLSVDEDGFRRAMAHQRERAREDRRSASSQGPALALEAATEFVGYDALAAPARGLAVLKNGEPALRAVAGDEVQVVLDTTPFYAESGGQVGDTGWLRQNGNSARVLDTVKRDGVTVHRARIESGALTPGM